MERILFKDMTEETKKRGKGNQIWESFPSGRAFQGFAIDKIETPQGVIFCDWETIYDDGFPCDSVRKYYICE